MNNRSKLFNYTNNIFFVNIMFLFNEGGSVQFPQLGKGTWQAAKSLWPFGDVRVGPIQIHELLMKTHRQGPWSLNVWQHAAVGDSGKTAIGSKHGDKSFTSHAIVGDNCTTIVTIATSPIAVNFISECFEILFFFKLIDEKS